MGLPSAERVRARPASFSVVQKRECPLNLFAAPTFQVREAGASRRPQPGPRPQIRTQPRRPLLAPSLPAPAPCASLRAPRPRLVPSPAELGSWGEGPRLLQGFRFRPFPTRFPIPRHPEPRPNPGGTGQPARGPGFPQLPLNPPTAHAQLSREPTRRQFNPWSLNDPASPDPTLRPFTKKTLPLRNWEPVPPLNVGCSYYQRSLHTRPPGVHSEVPHLGHQAQPNCFVCPRGPPLCSQAQSRPECCLPGRRQAHGQCVSSGAPLEDEDV